MMLRALCVCLLAVSVAASDYDELLGRWRICYAKGLSRELLADIGVVTDLPMIVLKRNTMTATIIKFEGDFYVFHAVLDSLGPSYRPPIGPLKIPQFYVYENPTFTQYVSFFKSGNGTTFDVQVKGAPIHYAEDYYMSEDGFFLQRLRGDSGATQTNFYYRIDDYRETMDRCAKK